MERLCEAFLTTIGSGGTREFEARQLMEGTGIQQRRVYDLMNILQGCGFVGRISVGRYSWFGFDESVRRKRRGQGNNKKASSLYSLAGRVKNILYCEKEEIGFKEVCRRVMEDMGMKQNPDTIRRRVYECCKVLNVLGLVTRQGGRFRWLQNAQRN